MVTQGVMDFTIEQIAQVMGKHRTTVLRQANKCGWPFREENVRGGLVKRYELAGLPAEVQIKLAQAFDLSPDTPGLCAAAAMTVMAPPDVSGGRPTPPPQTLTAAVSPTPHPATRQSGRQGSPAPGPLTRIEQPVAQCDASIINDSRVMRIAKILAECEQIPPGWGKRQWVEALAVREGTTFQTIYKWKAAQKKHGLAGLQHTKSTKGQATAWDEAALDWWIGLCLKRSHRKYSRKYLYYNALVVEANRRGWRIGSERSALEWAAKRITPMLERLQKGGTRGLDNALPPIMRSYADLDPFALVVGDQHRFDCWVTNPVTGEVLRPEGYFWQDLRTRLWYGGAVDIKYDSHLMGLALHIGCRAFGAFKCLYTDNGKPEQSKYIMQVAAAIRKLGMEADRTRDDIPSDLAGMDDDEDMPVIRIGQRFAVVKNSKAKMIEGSFRFLEQILRDQFGVPGYVKKLGGDIDEVDVDQAEIDHLAKAGKLLTFDEFRITLYRAMDWYNRVRPHRGAWREWSFGPRPREVRPADVLQGCYREGWRPRWVSPEALNLIFLPQETRTVTKGRIEIFGDFWEAPDAESATRLLGYEKQKVTVRYDPMALTELLVFDKQGRFITSAQPIEWGSMIDQDKTSRLIKAKRHLRKTINEEYQLLTAGIPDVRKFSNVPAAEKAAALVGREKKKRAQAAAALAYVPSDEELAENVAQLENYRPAPVRPEFRDADQRYEWCLYELADGRDIEPGDAEFMQEFEESWDEGRAEYWAIVRDSLGLKLTATN